MEAHDTSLIQRLIARARLRIRLQGALEGATTASILAAVTALAAIVAMRTETIGETTGTVGLVAAAAMILIGAAIGASRRIDDEIVARRIDRASNLSDRLSTAIAFRRALAGARTPSAETDGETIELMAAAIRDGVRATPRANVQAATPFRVPRDLKAALGFIALSALVAGLALPGVDHTPRIWAVDPPHAIAGAEVTLIGENLMTGVQAPVATRSTARFLIGAPGVADAVMAPRTFVPANGFVYIGPPDRGSPIEILDWTATRIRVRIPPNALEGTTSITAAIGNRVIGSVTFTVILKTDSRYFDEKAVVLDPDERAYVDAILAQLKELAQREHLEDLDKFIARIEQLLKDAEEGKITKEQLLAELAKAEEMLNQGMEPNQAEIAKKMGEMGKELQKSDVTKDLGKALEKNDLQKAKEELEELARRLERSQLEKQLEELKKQLQDPNLTEQQKQELQKKLDELQKQLEKDMKELEKQLQNKDLTEEQRKELQKKLEEMKKEKPLTEQQKQELQKQLENVSKQMQKQDQKDQQDAQQQQQKLEQEIRRLQKQKDEAKTEQERLSAERQLQKKRDELQKLQKDQDQKEQSSQRQALKRLQRDMEKAAEQMQKPQNKQESDEDKDERERQASQKLKDAARETGRVDQDQRKQASQKKMSSQMDDLREAMQRAKQKGNKGPNDPFGKNAKNSDFGKRARGKKGNGQAWRPGQGQGQGQQPGGQGQQPGGQKWGVGHDDNLTGDETAKSGNTKDADLQGETGGRGSSRRETILAAAQKGFASTSYKKVYQDYQRIVEEVMRTEKLPSSYKYYVKRYFAKIHPSGAPDSIDEVDTAREGTSQP